MIYKCNIAIDYKRFIIEEGAGHFGRAKIDTWHV